MSSNMYWIFHVICMVYCLWRLIKRSNKVSLDGVIGTTPGLDTIMVCVLAPILAIVDIVITWMKLYKDAERARIDNNKIF